MKNYEVYQGILNEEGEGSVSVCVGSFETLEEAKKCFNEVKDDYKGWNKAFKINYLTTELVELSNSEVLMRYQVKC